jgi:uncharacterized protein with HEPN domain
VKGDRLYLTHILDAIEKIERYIITFSFPPLTGRMRSFANLKSSAKQPRDCRSSSVPNIPESHGAVLRGCVMCHDYMGVDIRASWEITQKDLPVLKKSIEKILQATKDT